MYHNRKGVESIDHDMPIEEDLRLHHKGWVTQVIGKTIILSVMVSGLLGLYGEGWLSEQKVSDGNMRIEFESFYRYETEMKIKIEAKEHIETVSLPQQYFGQFRMVRMEPDPVNNNALGPDIVFNFQPGNNQTVTIYLIPKEYGRINGTMHINGTRNIALHHFIYP
jgi:hypothetical protein